MLLMAQFAIAPVALAPNPSPDDELPRLSREQVEWIVREYLLNNPEIIEQSMSVLQERREREAAEQARKALTDRADELFNDDMDPLVGNPDGPVQMVHFFDYQCEVFFGYATFIDGRLTFKVNSHWQFERISIAN